MELVDNNCRMNGLVENCGTTKVNEIVSVKKLKEKYDDVKNFVGENYDFVVLGDFLDYVNELNNGLIKNECTCLSFLTEVIEP